MSWFSTALVILVISGLGMKCRWGGTLSCSLLTSYRIWNQNNVMTTTPTAWRNNKCLGWPLHRGKAWRDLYTLSIVDNHWADQDEPPSSFAYHLAFLIIITSYREKRFACRAFFILPALLENPVTSRKAWTNGFCRRRSCITVRNNKKSDKLTTTLNGYFPVYNKHVM